jgi:hypothetical protein
MNEVWFEISEKALHSKLTVAGRNDSADHAKPLSERQII